MLLLTKSIKTQLEKNGAVNNVARARDLEGRWLAVRAWRVVEVTK